jgi:hypothetical protein
VKLHELGMNTMLAASEWARRFALFPLLLLLPHDMPGVTSRTAAAAAAVPLHIHPLQRAR